MIDLHTHILPGLDDGAKDWGEALEMARIACADGIGTVVATPHVSPGVYDNNRDCILNTVKDFNQLLSERRVPLRVLPGAEYRLDPDLPEQLAGGDLLTMNDGGRYLLLEFPSDFIPAHARRVVYELLLQGVAAVIVHPERNAALVKQPHILMDMVEKGALAQITAGSLTGLYGRHAASAAAKFIREGAVHFVASDAHSARGRSPVLSGALSALARLFGEETAKLLVCHNPAAVINNLPVEASGSLPAARKKKSWFNLFSGRYK